MSVFDIRKNQTAQFGFIRTGEIRLSKSNPVTYFHDNCAHIEEIWLGCKGLNEQVKIHVLHGTVKYKNEIFCHNLVFKGAKFWMTKSTQMKICNDIHFRRYYECWLWNGDILDKFVISKHGIDFSMSTNLQTRNDIPMDLISKLSQKDDKLASFIQLEGH